MIFIVAFLDLAGRPVFVSACGPFRKRRTFCVGARGFIQVLLLVGLG